MTKTKLPFDLTEESTADWLQSLSQLNSINSANQLNNVLLKLRKTNSPEVFHVLTQITPTILYISHNVETSLLAEGDKKNSKKSLKCKRLIIHLLRNLSMAFCTFTDKETLAAEVENQAIYFSLQIIGHTQRLATIFHEFPSTTLWGKTTELYLLAQERNIVSQEIKHKIRELKTLEDIETVLKRNLLFSILTPYRYNPNQIKELFLISEQHAQLILLNHEYSADFKFSWDTDSESAPYNKNNHQLNTSTCINIDIEKFLSFIQSTNFSSNFDKNEVLDHIIEALSGYKEVFNSTIPAAAVLYDLITTYSEITNYLESANKLDKIQRLSSQLDDTTPIEDLKLEPMEFEKNYLTPDPSPTSSNISVDLPEDALSAKILQTKHEKYLIAITNTTDCLIGNIVLLCNSKVNPELGIVRQIKLTRNSDITHLLIEKIPGTPSSQLIISPEIEEKKIILVQKQNSKQELLLPPCKFNNGTPIELASEQTFTLDKLIDYSPFYMHYLA